MKFLQNYEAKMTLLISSGKTVNIANIYNKIFAWNLAQYYPPQKCFNREFLLGVLRGIKKLLPLGCFGGFKLPYYTKSKRLTKDNIYQKFIGDSELLAYLPDNAPLAYLSREFLLSALFYGNREKYLDLYQQYKEIEL